MNILKKWEKLSNNELEELIKCLTDPDYDNEEENKDNSLLSDNEIKELCKSISDTEMSDESLEKFKKILYSEQEIDQIVKDIIGESNPMLEKLNKLQKIILFLGKNEEENKELLKFIDSQLDNILNNNSINTLSYKNNN